jgi:DNA-binding response OmpR family regulator
MTRVLVVDDEIDTLNLLRTILEISGYQAFTTLNSVDAITLAEVERPDLILLDIMMPNLDGFTLCKMMRMNALTKNLPIVFVTAYSALDLEERRLDAGADMVLPKPIGMDSLIEAVETATSLREHANAAVATKGTPPLGTPAPAPAAAAPVDPLIIASTAQPKPDSTNGDGTFTIGGPDLVVAPVAPVPSAPAPAAQPATPAVPVTSAPAPVPAASVAPIQSQPQPSVPAPASTPAAPATLPKTEPLKSDDSKK